MTPEKRIGPTRSHMPASFAASMVARNPSICSRPGSASFSSLRGAWSHSSKSAPAATQTDNRDVSFVDVFVLWELKEPLELLDRLSPAGLDERGFGVAQVVRSAERGRPLYLWMKSRVGELGLKQLVLRGTDGIEGDEMTDARREEASLRRRTTFMMSDQRLRMSLRRFLMKLPAVRARSAGCVRGRGTRARAELAHPCARGRPRQSTRRGSGDGHACPYFLGFEKSLCSRCSDEGVSRELVVASDVDSLGRTGSFFRLKKDDMP